MKISLRWLCDHIAVEWQALDVKKLVADFNVTTAEIENVTHYKLDITPFFLAKVLVVDQEAIAVDLAEKKNHVSIPFRSDVQIDQWYMVVAESADQYRWASYADLHSEKEGLLKAFSCQDGQAQDGSWRNNIETEDYIFEIDNKSITHRPDLWGHRGFAREVAALCKVAMVPESSFLKNQPIVSFEGTTGTLEGAKKLNISLKSSACTRLAVASIDAISYQPSALLMATRLIRLDSNHHNFFVDATNYVMFDLGHPMHAFDAATLTTETFEVCNAQALEKLPLLDGTEITLTPADVIISDGINPLSLAGIKGGGATGISFATHSLLIEAACFEPAPIRLSSMHHKLRTDASTRFEKSLDPENAPKALQRYLALLEEYAIAYGEESKILVLGKQLQAPCITITQQYIEQRLGLELPHGFVKATLECLDFAVVEIKIDGDIQYQITVPSFRATKDVLIKEDIVEEVGRYFGYTNIPKRLPHTTNKAAGLTWVDTMLTVKKSLAYRAQMHEVHNYAFFDNDFIIKLGWPLHNTVIVKNPLSAERTTLVTSLLPHLLQNVEKNMANNESLAFFEWARIWHQETSKVIEQQVLAGLWFEKKKNLDFYECKQHLIDLFEELDLAVDWKSLQTVCVWASAHQTAQLSYEGKVIGYAGILSNRIMHALGGGDVFAFELDGDFLKSYISAQRKFKQLPKYQATSLDVSVIAPLSVTVADIEKLIVHADSRIFEVALQDMFRKDEWKDTKSVTMRFFVRDETKTMDKQEIDAVYQAVVNQLTSTGLEVRA